MKWGLTLWLLEAILQHRCLSGTQSLMWINATWRRNIYLIARIVGGRKEWLWDGNGRLQTQRLKKERCAVTPCPTTMPSYAFACAVTRGSIGLLRSNGTWVSSLFPRTGGPSLINDQAWACTDKKWGRTEGLILQSFKCWGYIQYKQNRRHFPAKRRGFWQDSLCRDAR